jgi:hypothetical protein
MGKCSHKWEGKEKVPPQLSTPHRNTIEHKKYISKQKTKFQNHHKAAIQIQQRVPK